MNAPASEPAPSPPAANPVAVARSRARARVWSLLLVFLLGLFIARLPSTLGAIGATKPDTLDVVQDVFAMIERMYVDKPDPEKIRNGAINGMLEALDDPYAEFIPADDAAEFDKAMTGQFVGIGCQVEIRDGWLTVVSPIEDSPAYAAGVLANDRIIRIEDASTLGKSVDECIKMLTGQPKTPVNIIVQRDGKELPFTIVRDKIVSKSVRGFRRLPDGTGHWDYLLDPDRKLGYIRLSQFTPTSAKELKSALSEVRTQAGELQGLILDLRNNPGGYMQAALEIADIFLDDVVIMSVRGRDERMNEVFQATRSADKPSFPLVVLVNGSSASASEIVSGALQDHGRAVVIGERTFGKGLVQTVQPLPHSASAQVKFTTQRYYLPSGRLIQRLDNSTVWGVDPSPGFYVPMTEQELIAWVLHRRDQDILRKDTVPADFAEQRWNDPDWIKTNAKDTQLAAAVKALDSRLTAGEWVKLSDTPDVHGKIAETELRALERTRLRMSREFARIEKRIDTLEKQAAHGKPPEPKDLWPDVLDLTGGSIIVRDKDGNAVATLKITGRDVERWLENADVAAEKPAAGAPTTSTSTPAPAPESKPASPTP